MVGSEYRPGIEIVRVANRTRAVMQRVSHAGGPVEARMHGIEARARDGNLNGGSSLLLHLDVVVIEVVIRARREGQLIDQRIESNSRKRQGPRVAAVRRMGELAHEESGAFRDGVDADCSAWIFVVDPQALCTAVGDTVGVEDRQPEGVKPVEQTSPQVALPTSRIQQRIGFRVCKRRAKARE